MQNQMAKRMEHEMDTVCIQALRTNYYQYQGPTFVVSLYYSVCVCVYFKKTLR